MYSALHDSNNINGDFGQKWQLRNMANLILILPFWSGLLRAPERSLASQYFSFMKQWRRKGLSILGRKYNFLISYGRRSNFFPTETDVQCFKIHSNIKQSCSYTIATIENDPALFFIVFPCISMNIYVTCTTDQMAVIWTTSNLSLFKKRLLIWLTHLYSSLSMNVGDCQVKSNQRGAAVFFSISLNDYSKLLQLHTQGRIQANK